ncbi:MAG: radical SAM protein [Bacteroidetes bacterium CG2_30_32_10]|nr:MAG: radical SAM protein [Bacteroidetes bacterium CG2_30_32_10]
MLDSYNRNINYLRISVTDRCNLRCLYCMPEEGFKLLKHEEILSYEEIIEVVNIAVDLGITKVRITGGEPLVRKGIIDFIKMISKNKGLDEVTMTTNGILLSDFATSLVEAGLSRINISLDTIDAKKFYDITRGGDLNKVIAGIEAIQKAGISQIKVNCVIKKSSKEPDAKAVKAFCDSKGIQARFIHQMNLEKGQFSIVEGGSGGDCHNCNRLRLTANGKIKPCLFSDLEFDVRKLGAKNAIIKAIGEKPASGTYNNSGNFYNIGG